MHGRERNAGIADEAREGDKDQVGEILQETGFHLSTRRAH